MSRTHPSTRPPNSQARVGVGTTCARQKKKNIEENRARAQKRVRPWDILFFYPVLSFFFLSLSFFFFFTDFFSFLPRPRGKNSYPVLPASCTRRRRQLRARPRSNQLFIHTRHTQRINTMWCAHAGFFFFFFTRPRHCGNGRFFVHRYPAVFLPYN